MCRTSLRHSIEVRIPQVEHSDPRFPRYSSSEGQVGNENGYRYCVDLLDELWDCWLIYDIYSLNSNVKGDSHILHNLIICKCSIIFSCLVYLWFKCVVKILLVGKTFFCLNTFQLSENSIVRKMFYLPQL